MELVSIIVPVYNVEKYLYRCIKSVLNQSYKNIEVILVDDGSPDRCPQICDELADKYKIVKVIHKKNGGLSSARNAGLDMCSGKYISFIDSDDFVDRDFIKRLYECCVKYEAEVAMLQYEEVNADENLKCIKTNGEIVFEGKSIEEAFLKLKIDSVCVGLYSREIINGYRFLEGKTSEDIPFNFEIFKKTKKFVYIPEKRYYYYYNINSISNGKLDKNMLNYMEFRKQIYNYYEDTEFCKLAEALYARAAMGLQTRMAIYGISEELKEKECKKEFTKVFNQHKYAFYKEKSIPITRKIISVVVFKCYWIVRMMGKIKR